MLDGPYGFGSEGYLLLLVLAPVAAAIAGWSLGWRRDARASFGGLTRETGSRRILTVAAPALIVGAIVATAFAAARPQAGERQITAEQKGIDLVVVMDVSSSMLATDSEPSRIGRAQAEVGALLDRMDGDHAGLVIFGRTAFVRSPLTVDLRALHGIVDSVSRERALVQPGSDLGGAIRAAQTLVRSGHADTKAILIVSDGEDHGSSIAGAVADARKANIRIYTAGAGTDAGAPVLDVNATSGQVTPRTDRNGQLVLTRRDEDALRTIAQNGDGHYIALDGEGRPLAALAAEFDSLATTTFGSAPARELNERFQIFAAIALLLVVAEFLLPALARPRSAMRTALRVAPLAGAGMLVAAICTATAADVNRRGNDAYETGDFAAALDYYKTAESMDPARAELYHNAGNAYDQQGDYARAIDETKRAPEPKSTAVGALLQYALGNHYAGAEQLRDAIEAYKRALLASPDDQDAKHNLEAAIARLTPSPTPTATPGREGTATPAPGDGTPNSEGESTPGADGTPGAGGTPQPDDRPLTDEQVQQELAEALRGLDRNFTEEEAQRVLDLLARKNQQTVEDLANEAAPNGLPDY